MILLAEAAILFQSYWQDKAKLTGWCKEMREAPWSAAA
jgi:hypothetical protein